VFFAPSIFPDCQNTLANSALALKVKSKQSRSDLVFNKLVEVEYHKKDKYGRTVGKIVVDGVDANLEQVKAGMAWHYKKYQQEQTLGDRSRYAQAEEQARVRNRGLWKDADPTPPWDWRRLQKVRYRRPF
jgi:endonuclease YncB( thermonuclease family)